MDRLKMALDLRETFFADGDWLFPLLCSKTDEMR